MRGVGYNHKLFVCSLCYWTQNLYIIADIHWISEYSRGEIVKTSKNSPISFVLIFLFALFLFFDWQHLCVYVPKKPEGKLQSQQSRSPRCELNITVLKHQGSSLFSLHPLQY